MYTHIHAHKLQLRKMNMYINTHLHKIQYAHIHIHKTQLKMIELKLSQGAKPGHGGMLPKAKVTPFIAEARGIEMGMDCNSPPAHSAFNVCIIVEHVHVYIHMCV